MKKAVALSIVALTFAVTAQTFSSTLKPIKDKTVLSVNDEETVVLKITGMTCGGCAGHVSKALTELEGVLSENVSYPGDRNTITYNPKKTTVEKIIAAIEKTGYKAEVIKAVETEKG